MRSVGKALVRVGAIAPLLFLSCAHTDDAGSWRVVTARGDVPSQRIKVAASRVDDETVYLFGGMDVTTGPDLKKNFLGPREYYDDLFRLDLNELQTPSWSAVSPIGSPPSPRAFSASVAFDDHFCVFGGSRIEVNKQGFGTIDSVEFADLHCYDPATNHWMEMPPGAGGPPPARQSPILLADEQAGRLYLVGGLATTPTPAVPFAFPQTKALNDLWIYKFTDDGAADGLQRGWNRIEPGGEPGPNVWIGSGMLLEDELLVIAGEDLTDPLMATFRDTVFSYARHDNTWRQRLKHPLALRVDAGAARRGRRVYLYGGYQGGDRCGWAGGFLPEGPVNSMVIYDIENNAFEAGAPNPFVPQGQRRHTVVTSGRSLIAFGGFGCADSDGTGPSQPFYPPLDQLYVYEMR